MITKLGIKNFKSIKDLELDCKRVNVFIGEPNTGKSNILEALGLLSWCGHDSALPVATFDHSKFDESVFGGGKRPSGLGKYVRLQYIENLFNDNSLTQPITISIKAPDYQISVNLSLEQERHKVSGLPLDRGAIDRGGYTLGQEHYKVSASLMKNNKKDTTEPITDLDQSGNLLNGLKKIPWLDFIKFYRFKDITEFSDSRSEYLMPPNGENMFAVVKRHEKFKETMQNFFSDSKFKFVIKTSEKQFGFQEEEKGTVTSYPYIISSDTLRHIVFFAIAIESNKDASLVFEEPESHAFPYYTKWLGERIALYSNNQFFIATHNPYLLSALMEKTKIRDLNVFVTYMHKYQTKAISLTDDQIGEIMVEEPFFNLARYIPEESA